MFVVADTNQFFSDFRMKKSSFRILLGQHRVGLMTIVVPEIVLREVAKNFASEAAKPNDKKIAAQEKMVDLGLETTVAQRLDVPTIRDEFAREMRQRLEGETVGIPGPEAELASLIDRSLAERRPFQQEGKGFRDALIWCNVMKLAEDDEVALISKNWSDFGRSKNEPNELHPHLRDELQSRFSDPERVKLFTSLADFISKRVEGSEGLEQAVRLYETETGWRSDLDQAIIEAFDSMDLSRESGIQLVPHTEAYLEFEGMELETLESVTLESCFVENEGSQEVILLLTATVELRALFSTDRAGAEWIASEDHLLDLEFLGDQFVLVRSELHEVGLEFSVTFNKESNEFFGLEYLEESAREIRPDSVEETARR